MPLVAVGVFHTGQAYLEKIRFIQFESVQLAKKNDGGPWTTYDPGISIPYKNTGWVVKSDGSWMIDSANKKSMFFPVVAKSEADRFMYDRPTTALIVHDKAETMLRAFGNNESYVVRKPKQTMEHPSRRNAS